MHLICLIVECKESLWMQTKQKIVTGNQLLCNAGKKKLKTGQDKKRLAKKNMYSFGSGIVKTGGNSSTKATWTNYK